MLTKQGGLLEQSLIEGGLNPLAANAAAAAVANCSQRLQHRGPVSADYTPPDFDFITAELRKFRFPNLESVSGEMPRIRPSPSEEKPPEEDRKPLPPETENQNLRQPFQPTYRDDGSSQSFRVTAGRYIRVDGGNRVSLNASGGTGDVAVFQGDRLVGLKLDVKSGDEKLLKVDKGQLTFTIKPQGSYADVVTDIALDGDRLKIMKRRAYLLGAGPERDDSIDMEELTYVHNVEDSGSLTFIRETMKVLGSPAVSASPITIPVVDCTV